MNTQHTCPYIIIFLVYNTMFTILDFISLFSLTFRQYFCNKKKIKYMPECLDFEKMPFSIIRTEEKYFVDLVNA